MGDPGHDVSVAASMRPGFYIPECVGARVLPVRALELQ